MASWASPTCIARRGSYDTPGQAWSVAAAGDYAYIADGGSGLIILRYRPTYSISGQVQDSNENPISGVTVSTAGYSATTDASGVYTITDLISGTYTLTPTKSNYTFTPPSRSVSVPPNQSGVDFVGTPPNVVIDQNTDGAIVYTDTQSNPTVVEFPVGAVTETTTIICTPLDTATPPSGFSFAGHAFTLEAYRGDALLPSLGFEAPVTITIYYTDTDVTGLDEETLELQYWTGSAWTTDGITLVERNPTQKYAIFTITHLSEFALLGKTVEGGYTIYLPLVVRNQ